MRERSHILFCFVLIVISSCFGAAHAQLGFDPKIQKPKPYEDRVLKAEKTGDQPLNATKKFFQNLTTHYNYFFNASARLNEVIDGAKASFKDDYTSLLPFYNFTLDATAQNATQLDSVIYKAQTGIVMHDLRNDWIDNMYLLWGAAWFLEKKFDSASLMFQFINYAFAEKEKDGYYRYIGSRIDGNNALTVSTKEEAKFPKNTVTPPSRNNAFIWQIRSMIELGLFAQSGSLIATLKNDPAFPKRLNDDLEEVQAYWFYKQNIWDSSAAHLVNALDQAKTKQERARWEFLAAQMLERSGKFEEAQNWYAKSINHTTDPVMDVYARLNMVRINKDTSENYIDKNIAELLKMAKRDKYVDYRDIIYFMAAQMELERNNIAAAQELLIKSAKNNNGNLSSRNKSYLLIADLAYEQGKYDQAASFYDSLQARDLEPDQSKRVNERKASVAKILGYQATVRRQDSLQRIAAMPEDDRINYLTRLVRRLRIEQGLSDVPTTSGTSLPSNPNAPTDLFSANQSKGEWYFYNTNLKSQGLMQFKQTWGTRPNVDNWRRFADLSQQLVVKTTDNTRPGSKDVTSIMGQDNTPTIASLQNGLPLTPMQLQASNDSIQNAMYNLGVAYMNDVENYNAAIEAFENFRTRFPNYAGMNEVLFHLYYAYTKAGNFSKAAEIKQLILQKYPDSRYTTIIKTGKDPATTAGAGEATKAYEEIYDLFISGKFDEAELAKKRADSVYHTSHWQPQLLYIEAVYQIKQRQDSIAKNTLQTIIGQDPNSPLAAKAQNMIEVLGRRKQIEDELARLQIERPKEDTVVEKPVVYVAPPPVKKDSVVSQAKTQVVVTPPKQIDSAIKKPFEQPKVYSVYKFDPAAKQYVMIILDKVDPVFVNEAKNAFDRYNKEVYYNNVFDISIKELDADRKLVLIGGFANPQEVIDYVQKAKRLAPSEIVPWLKADKYSFSIMTDANLNILLSKKDLKEYQLFLDQNLPGKF